MILSFFRSFRSEWLKTRRSLATWLVVIGGFFIPLIMLVGRLVYAQRYKKELLSPQFWTQLLSQCWQFMAIFLLPMGVILATSLITQIEFRNNTWKQLHTTPQSFGVIFWAKLTVILLMMLQFFGLFNIGIYLAGVLPALLLGVQLPTQAFPFELYLSTSGYFFLDCLPIVGLQYLVSLQFRNFLVPLSVGIGLLLASLIGAEWEYGYTLPYTYCLYHFFSLRNASLAAIQNSNIHLWASGYFVALVAVGFALYWFKPEKG